MTEIASYTDRYGDERVIHQTRNGLKLKRQGDTPALLMTREAALLFGVRVRELRIKRGYGLAELAIRAGLRTQTPKSRMWEIENNVRSEGVRFGTLYALAIALDVEVADLLPTVAEVVDAAGVGLRDTPEVQL